ncbi:MAG: hypothetical protein ACKVWV_16350 [Planctomycetota bacterium]
MKPAVSLRALILLALVVPAGLSIAHQYVQGDAIDQINPGPLGMAEFGKIVAGEFNGDHVLDCFVEDDGEPKLVVWPESHKNAHGIGAYANDFDVFHNFVSGKDALVTVDYYGLRLWVYDSDTDTFDVTVIADETSAWCGAILVREAEVDGTNGKDIIGVAANGNDVLVMLNDGDNTFTAGTGHTNPNDIYDMVVVNWRETGDTSGTDEIATFTPSNWQVREPNGGQILKTTAFSVSTIYGCAINWGGATECLVLVGRSSGQDWMATYGTGGFTDGPYPLGDLKVVSLASGDANGDGRSEVFAGTTSERKISMWVQDDTAPLFTHSAPVKFNYGPAGWPVAQNNATIVVDDFDGDGHNDFLTAAQGDLTVPISAYGSLVLKQLGYGTSEDLKAHVSVPTYNFLANPDELSFRLDEPQTTMPVDEGNIAMLRVDVWQTSNLQGVTSPRTTIKSDVIDMPWEEGATFMFKLPAGYNPMAGGSTETYTVVVRQVEVEEEDETETVLDEGPARVYTWVPERHYATFSAASDVVTPTLTIGIDTEETPPSGGGGTGPTTPAPPDGYTPKR